MRKWVKWSLAGGGVVIVLVIGLGLLSRSIGFNVGSCSTDDEATAAERAPFEDEALRFVNAALISDPGTAYGDFAAEAKQKISPEQFGATTRTLRSIISNLTKAHVEHIFYVRQFGAGASLSTLCTAAAHESLSEGKVLVAAKAVNEQAHVIVEGENNNDTWSFTLWLLPEQGKVRVNSFWAEQTTMAGKSTIELRNLARAQWHQNHNLNAAVLYSAAKDLAFRGPNLQLGIYPEIAKELSEVKLPAEVDGKPPFNWRLGADTYRVLGVAAVEVKGKLAIAIRQETPALMDDQDADAANHKLIAALRTAHPEFGDAFDEILVQITDAHGLRQFATVEDLPRTP